MKLSQLKIDPEFQSKIPLGRRNLSPERKKFLLGKEYESTKLAVGGQPGNCNKIIRGCCKIAPLQTVENSRIHRVNRAEC